MLRSLWIVVWAMCLNYASASHILGGQLYYDYVNDSTYIVSLQLLADRSIDAGMFDEDVPLQIWQKGDTAVEQIKTLPLISETQKPVSLYMDYCRKASIYQAYNFAYLLYQDTVEINDPDSNYFFAYQRCCRSEDLVNLSWPGEQGISLYAEVFPGKKNFSPRMNEDFPLMLSDTGQYQMSYHSVDIDGDSLVYEFYTPYQGGSLTSVNPGNSGDETPPPYSPVVYMSGYGQDKPMGNGEYEFHSTGTLTMLLDQAVMLGKYAMGVKVTEYRNGEKLSSLLLEAPLMVVNSTEERTMITVTQDRDTICEGCEFVRLKFNSDRSMLGEKILLTKTGSTQADDLDNWPREAVWTSYARSFEVPIRGKRDTITEGDERIEILYTLEEDNKRCVRFDKGSIDFVINECDRGGDVIFSLSDLSVDEGCDEVSLNFEANELIDDRFVSWRYEGDALFGEDYTVPTDSLTVGPGESFSVPLTTILDYVIEDTEGIHLYVTGLSCDVVDTMYFHIALKDAGLEALGVLGNVILCPEMEGTVRTTSGWSNVEWEYLSSVNGKWLPWSEGYSMEWASGAQPDSERFRATASSFICEIPDTFEFDLITNPNPVITMQDTLVILKGEKVAYGPEEVTESWKYIWSDGEKDSLRMFYGDSLEVGIHEYSLTVYSEFGCRADKDLLVKVVLPDGNLGPEGTDLWQVVQSDQKLTLSGLEHSGVQVEIMDVGGRRIFFGRFRDTAVINLDDLNSGGYFLVMTGQNHRKIHRFVKP